MTKSGRCPSRCCRGTAHLDGDQALALSERRQPQSLRLGELNRRDDNRCCRCGCGACRAARTENLRRVHLRRRSGPQKVRDRRADGRSAHHGNLVHRQRRGQDLARGNFHIERIARPDKTEPCTRQFREEQHAGNKGRQEPETRRRGAFSMAGFGNPGQPVGRLVALQVRQCLLHFRIAEAHAVSRFEISHLAEKGLQQSVGFARRLGLLGHFPNHLSRQRGNECRSAPAAKCRLRHRCRKSSKRNLHCPPAGGTRNSLRPANRRTGPVPGPPPARSGSGSPPHSRLSRTGPPE